MKKNILGVVLARGNSKGLKKKNFLKIKGKSLVEIAINNALKNKKLTKIIFSSSDKSLIKIAKKKIKVDFQRPKNLSKDTSSTYDVIKHAINWLEKNKAWKTDIVVILSPTTPFRKAKHIDAVISLLIKNKADAAMTITEPDFPPHWMFKKTGKKLKFLFKRGKNIHRRQDSPKVYQPAGMVYALKKEFLFKMKGILPQSKTLGLHVKREEAIDIDNEIQFNLAKMLSKKYL